MREVVGWVTVEAPDDRKSKEKRRKSGNVAQTNRSHGNLRA